MKRIIAVTMFLCLIGCSKNQISSNPIPRAKVDQLNWELIDQIEAEKWNKEKLLRFFGQPNEIINEKNNANKYLIYDDPNSGHQRWSFEINKNLDLTHITFIPDFSNGENFTEKKINEKWGSSCKRKKDIDKTQHFIKYIYYLDCGEIHRAYFNNHNEVISLSIKILN